MHTAAVDDPRVHEVRGDEIADHGRTCRQFLTDGVELQRLDVRHGRILRAGHLHPNEQRLIPLLRASDVRLDLLHILRPGAPFPLLQPRNLSAEHFGFTDQGRIGATLGVQTMVADELEKSARACTLRLRKRLGVVALLHEHVDQQLEIPTAIAAQVAGEQLFHFDVRRRRLERIGCLREVANGLGRLSFAPIARADEAEKAGPVVAAGVGVQRLVPVLPRRLGLATVEEHLPLKDQRGPA